MTPTTPTKSPVDTIREYLLDRKSALDASLKYVMPYNVQKLIEDEFLRVCELLTALSSLSTQPAQTMMSTDYEALYELLCKGGEALGTRTSKKTGVSKRAPLLLRLCDDGGFDFQQGWEQTGKLYSKSQFIAECTRLKLEWVAPLPSQTEGLEEMRDELELLGSMIRAERANPTQSSQECTEEQLERCYALRDKMESLPRQKGEVVAWMTDDGKVISASGKLHMEEAEHPVGIHYDIPLYK